MRTFNYVQFKTKVIESILTPPGVIYSCENTEVTLSSEMCQTSLTLMLTIAYQDKDCEFVCESDPLVIHKKDFDLVYFNLHSIRRKSLRYSDQLRSLKMSVLLQTWIDSVYALALDTFIAKCHSTHPSLGPHKPDGVIKHENLLQALLNAKHDQIDLFSMTLDPVYYVTDFICQSNKTYYLNEATRINFNTLSIMCLSEINADKSAIKTQINEFSVMEYYHFYRSKNYLIIPGHQAITLTKEPYTTGSFEKPKLAIVHVPFLSDYEFIKMYN